MSTAAPLDNGAACANCDTPLGGHYCANCGQEAVLHHASVREFLHEFIGHYVALEGKLWGSLKRLIFQPGELTNEYIRGRRVRYVQPLRMYLTFSVLFFALLKFTGGDAGGDAHVDGKASISKEAAAREGGKGDVNINGEYIEARLAGWPLLQHQWHTLNQLPPDEQVKVFKNGMNHYAPYAIFCLMPVFALFLKALYLGSGRRFGEHMLFALHSNGFAFLMFSVILLARYDWLQLLLWCWLILYLPWAMRRVYHRSRFGTFCRWALLMLAYMVALFCAVLASAAMGILTVGH